MPRWISWIVQHWFALSIIVLAIIAVTYVWNNRKSLFYKE